MNNTNIYTNIGDDNVCHEYEHTQTVKLFAEYDKRFIWRGRCLGR